MLRSKIEALPYMGGVNIIDADGNVINSSTTWPAPKVNVADRAYFRTFRYDPQAPDVLIEPVYSRISGAWTILIVRKIMGPHGEFMGVVGRGIEPANFEKFFETVVLGESATISMLHRDGTLLARFPHSSEMMGHNFRNGPFEQQKIFALDHFAGRFVSPVDGEDRLVSARALPHFPILMMATTTRAAALADWREQIGILISVAGASALAIAGVLIAIVRKLLAQHRMSRERLTLEKQRLDRAVNNMTQGLLLFDASQKLVVCNQRYIEMYGLSAEIVKPGYSFRDIIAASQGHRLVPGRRRPVCRARAARHPRAQLHGRRHRRRPFDPDRQRAARRRRLGRDPRGHHRTPPHRGAHHPSRALRRADRPAEPRHVPRTSARRARSPSSTAKSSRCTTSTSTSSRASTTRSAISSATSC